MGPIHPLVVHLPIGLLVGNAILTLWYLRSLAHSARRDVEQAAFHALQLGTLCLLPTIAAGVWDAIRHLGQQPGSAALMWINAHGIAGLLVLLVYWQAWQLRRREAAILDDVVRRRGYLARLAIGCALLLISGWIGGHMVYDLGVGTR